MDVTLPGNLFTDPATTHYRRGYRAARLVVHQNIFRQARARKCLRMRLCAWALNWGRSVNQIKAIYAQMEADGLCTWTVEGEGGRDDFATFTWSDAFVPPDPATCGSEAIGKQTAPRPRFPSDEEYNRRRQEERRNGHTSPLADSAVDSALTPPPTPPSAPVTVPDSTGQPESVLLKTTGQPEPEPDGQPVESPGAIIEAFVRMGMEPHQAEERLREFGVERCRDALDTLAYRREKKAVPSPVGLIVDFLVHQRPVPAGLVKWREARATSRGQPKVRYTVRPIPETPVDPEKAAKWHSRVEQIMEKGGK